MIQVVWFKRDLRTCDHAPLAEAASAGPVLPLYVAEPDYWRLPDVSTRQWIVQAAALEALSHRLSELGAPLIVRVGSVVDILDRIHASVGIARLLAHQETGNLWTFRRDIAVRAFCRRHRIRFLEFSQTGLIRGAGARDRWAAHFGRFVAAPIVPEPVQLTPVTAAKVAALPTAETLGLRDDGCNRAAIGNTAGSAGSSEQFSRRARRQLPSRHVQPAQRADVLLAPVGPVGHRRRVRSRGSATAL